MIEVSNNLLLAISLGIGALVLIILYLFSSNSTSIEGDVEDIVKNSYLQANEWLNVGEETKNATEKVVAFTRALAFLNSIRISLKDEVLEDIVKDDVVLFAKTLEEKQISSIKAIDDSSDTFASTFVIR